MLKKLTVVAVLTTGMAMGVANAAPKAEEGVMELSSTEMDEVTAGFNFTSLEQYRSWRHSWRRDYRQQRQARRQSAIEGAWSSSSTSTCRQNSCRSIQVSSTSRSVW